MSSNTLMEGTPDVRTAVHRLRSVDPDSRRPGRWRHRRTRPVPGSQAPLTEPTVTALIPAHNEGATIVECVESCWNQTYPVTEVIVAADSCTDNTAELARQAGARVFETDCKDKARAQNEVLPYVNGDLIAGIDGDSTWTPDAIKLMVHDVESGEYAGTCAAVLPSQPTGFFVRSRRFGYALGRAWWRRMQNNLGRLQVLTGAAYMFRTDALRGIGGFPLDLMSADMNVTWELYHCGYRLTFTHRAMAYTMEPESFTVYYRQMCRWAAGYFQTMARHRRQLWHPASFLVCATSMFDLLTLPAAYGSLIWRIGWHQAGVRWLWAWLLGHAIVTIALVARSVGVREAIRCFIPYYVVNFLNKGIYIWTFIREWLLGRHYAAWTGRQGRKTEITPMTPTRKAVLGCVSAAIVAASGYHFDPRPEFLLAAGLFLLAAVLAPRVRALLRRPGQPPESSSTLYQLADAPSDTQSGLHDAA